MHFLSGLSTGSQWQKTELTQRCFLEDTTGGVFLPYSKVPLYLQCNYSTGQPKRI